MVYLFLLFDDIGNVAVVDGRMDYAFHKGAAIIIFDETLPSVGWHFMLF